MAFYKELKESRRERRIMQVLILLVMVVVEGLVWYLSDSPKLKVSVSILVLALGAFLIFAQTDYWRIRQWKKGQRSLEKFAEETFAEAEKEAEKKLQVNVKKLSEYLPSFSHMEKDATAEEVMRVAALAETILNLTFKNPVNISQDPVFGGVLKANNEWAKEQLANGKYTIEAHEELKEAYTSKYSESMAKQMMEIDYWNQRMIEHAVLTGTLGPKPAFQCLQAALSLRALFHSLVLQQQEALDLCAIECEACDILTVNYAHLLLKSTTLPMQNPALIGDITKVLKQASTFLRFDEGMKYEPKNRSVQAEGNRDLISAEPKEPSEEKKESSGKLMRPKFSKEETLALGTMALSFIVVNGRPDEKAEPVIINELEGFTVEDVKQMYMNLMKDQARLSMVLHKSCMFDPFRKMYATGFLAKVIQSRSDGGKAPLVEMGWKKVVRNIFGFGGDGAESIEAGVKLYDRFEHPQIDFDTFFLISSWVSQVNYK